MADSFLLPTFMKKLADPEIKNILMCGCGGGFDFVHGLLLYPELKRLGKNVIIGSYSFGKPENIKGEAPIVFSNESGNIIAKHVTAKSEGWSHYAPEVGMCSFLDKKYPDDAPHSVYAYYARVFSVPVLKKLYDSWVEKHQIDAVVIIDGGTDSLMAGDEEGLGDPIEDCVSVTAAASLNVKEKILLAVGFGADRFNHVSDHASLRAVGELTKAGGFLGSVSLEQNSEGFKCYSEGLTHIYEQQQFRSVLSGLIIAAGNGYFGFEVPPSVGGRVREGESFIWALMAMFFAFDLEKVVERSLLSKAIGECESYLACNQAMNEMRKKLKQEGKLRNIENLPTHEAMRAGW
eukprot:TRINITY_DN66476_c7_g1_i1.p1 TRINITY_DN66476_c7_g1~~TRINITY_DN66476_c7_g1_i1.p1  ORF type:complete len:361 (-),score=38.76 TRINITY_DN66476_c7_g1_i1:418-1461(-)